MRLERHMRWMIICAHTTKTIKEKCRSKHVCYVVHKFKITILNINSLNAGLILTVRLQPFPTQLAHMADHFSCRLEKESDFWH